MAHGRLVGVVLLFAVLSPSLEANSALPGPGTTELGPVTSVIWQPTPAELADNYLWTGGGSNTNFGTSPNLMVGYWGNPEWNRAILRFPSLPLPANATLVSAHLELYMHAADTPDAMAISVHGMTSPWTEYGSTWNDMDGSNPWNATGGGGDFDPAFVDIVPSVTNVTGWYSWNVTTLAHGWWNGSLANEGLLVRQANDDLAVSLGRKEFSSSDMANASARPRLRLAYRPSPAGFEIPAFFPWLLLVLIAIPFAWLLVLRAQSGPFRPTDLYLIHEDGRLILRVGGAEGPVRDELAASGMFTLVAQFVRDSFGGPLGKSGELKRLTVDDRAVAIAKGGFLFLALVFDGAPPADLDRRIAEFLQGIEMTWGPKLHGWDGLRDRVAGLEAPLGWFLQTGYRFAHPRPPTLAPVLEESRG